MLRLTHRGEFFIHITDIKLNLSRYIPVYIYILKAYLYRTALSPLYGFQIGALHYSEQVIRLPVTCNEIIGWLTVEDAITNVM